MQTTPLIKPQMSSGSCPTTAILPRKPRLYVRESASLICKISSSAHIQEIKSCNDVPF